MFLFFAFAGTQVANSSASSSGNQSTELPQGPNPIVLLYISLAFAFSLTVNAWIFFRVSGGLFNPAVSDSQASRISCLGIPSRSEQELVKLTQSTGNAWAVSRWCSSVWQRSIYLHCTNARCYG